MAEVRKHNREEDVWIVVKGKVYDCTEYLDLHPGAAVSILINAGEDSTEDVVAIHSTKATKMLNKFYVGDLDLATGDNAAQVEEDRACERTGSMVAFDPKHKRSFTLQKKAVLSRDSFKLDFALQTPDHVLDLPTGKDIFLSGDVYGEMVVRRYTPITSDHDVGRVKFVIETYPPYERFPLGEIFSAPRRPRGRGYRRHARSGWRVRLSWQRQVPKGARGVPRDALQHDRGRYEDNLRHANFRGDLKECR